jgi:hypothetical protein
MGELMRRIGDVKEYAVHPFADKIGTSKLGTVIGVFGVLL